MEVKVEVKVGPFVIFESTEDLVGRFYPKRAFLQAVNKLKKYEEVKHLEAALRGFEFKLPAVKPKNAYVAMAFRGFSIEIFTQPKGGNPLVDL